MRRQRGFTLIEILVVLVIISVMVGALALSIAPNPHKALERELLRLRGMMDLAMDEALIGGKLLGLAAAEDHYQWLQFDESQRRWVDLPGRGTGSYRLDAQIRLELVVDGFEINAVQRRALARLLERGGDQDLQPAILFLASGESSAFRLRLHHQLLDQYRELASDGVSGVTMR